MAMSFEWSDSVLEISKIFCLMKVSSSTGSSALMQDLLIGLLVLLLAEVFLEKVRCLRVVSLFEEEVRLVEPRFC